MHNLPVVTITFFKFKAIKKLWMLQQMQLAQKPIRNTPGLHFFKLMGSGYGNGFSLKPDFSTYALVCSWQYIEAARHFFDQSVIFKRFKQQTEEYWTTYMHTTAAHGKWSGMEPFPVTALPADNTHSVIGVITRGTIATKHLYRFWKQTPAVSAAIAAQPGLIFTKGIGELPIVQQATFSLWQSKKDMVNFAYRHEAHTKVIKQTRELGWYTEELFAQFKPIASDGTWNGSNPLQNYLQNFNPQII
jgi:hypothetical protein